MCLKLGTGTTKNMPGALAWFKKSADQNNAQSQFELGMLHWDGLAVDQDYAAAFAWFIKSANQGLAVGQAMTGFCYQTGYGINKNQTLAASWYLKSAEQGNPIAQAYYGKMLLNGQGTEADPKAAREWIKKSADQGYTDAEASISLILLGEKNYQLASQYAQRAATKGDAIGQFAQGVCLQASKDQKNRDEGQRLMTMSAEQGFAYAQVTLGELHRFGINGKKDPQEAVKWFKKAAEQGDAQGQFALGACYYLGDGVIKDEIEAYALLNLSGVTNPKARELLQSFEVLLSTEARLVGQQRAKQLLKEIESRKASTEGQAETFQQLLKEAERERSKKGA
jgi:TPR repeat protein